MTDKEMKRLRFPNRAKDSFMRVSYDELLSFNGKPVDLVSMLAVAFIAVHEQIEEVMDENYSFEEFYAMFQDNVS